MQSIQNKWFRSTLLFVKNQTLLLFLLIVLFWTATACQKNEPERVHIKGRIVTKGTGDPILRQGIKFGIYEAQPTTGFLTPQQHLLIDSFETNANGMFEHTFKNTGLIENMSVKQISVIPGYAEHEFRYRLVNDSKQFEQIEQTKRIVLKFCVDNRLGNPLDSFGFIVPGSDILLYVGNGFACDYFKTRAYTPLRMVISDFQKDTQYNIDVFFETLDTAHYTFIP